MIANVVQVTSQPIQLAICAQAQFNAWVYWVKGVFGVSILSEDTPMTLLGSYFKSGRDTDKFCSLWVELEQIPPWQSIRWGLLAGEPTGVADPYAIVGEVRRACFEWKSAHDICPLLW